MNNNNIILYFSPVPFRSNNLRSSSRKYAGGITDINRGCTRRPSEEGSCFFQARLNNTLTNLLCLLYFLLFNSQKHTRDLFIRIHHLQWINTYPYSEIYIFVVVSLRFFFVFSLFCGSMKFIY